jgi:hypothetical protein
MPLSPVKDRTISLTLEKDLKSDATNGTGQALLKPSQSFTDKFLPSSGLAGAVARNVFGAISPTLKLVGPMSIDFNYEADVAVEPGLFTSYIQPWFVKPVQISIKGESYLGTYTLISRADRDVEDALSKLMSSLNDFSERVGSPGNKSRVLLEIKNNPRGARRFLGYVRHLSFGENVSTPFILNYEIGFVGRSVDNMEIVSGKNNARAALKRAGG